MEELRTVRLYGKMGARFGRVHHLAVRTPAEAVQALAAQLPGFEAYMYGAKEQGFGFAVFNGKTNISKEELTFPSGPNDIRIAPMVFGAKNGFLQIIVGGLLMIAGFLLTPAFPMLGPALFNMGLAMVIGGVVQLLMPIPKNKTKEMKEDPNYSFNGPVNTTAQGHPVPLLYGRLKTGSAVISAGISLKDEVVIPTGSSGGTTTGGGSIWDQLDEYLATRNGAADEP